MDGQKYQPIIGLEIHVGLKTKSKMFCGCNADWFGKEPNTLCCPVCLGLPGALPVPNRKAVEWCVMLGMALNCQIPKFSKFDRKNYFYPDLPKGYQISQYDKPLAVNGNLKVKSEKLKVDKEKIIRIRRVHLEEDTGKLIHATVDGEKCTLIDFNRSGVPLVEIVTEPDIRSSEEARIFLKKLRQIIRYLGISDADMEKGSMRIEPNISMSKVKSQKSKVKTAAQNLKLNKMAETKYTSKDESRKAAKHRPGGRKDSWRVGRLELPPYKVEIKNINSFNFTKRAIDYEISRQIKLLMMGKTPIQETRGWDEKRGVTYSQRGKEEAHDYRYFPEPDIPPIRWLDSQLSVIKNQIPELPDEKMVRFIRDYSLSVYNATILVDTCSRADYFEEAVKIGKKRGVKAKTIANLIVNKKVDIDKTTPARLIESIIKETKREEIPEGQLRKVIDKVITENPKAVKDYKKGKKQAIMFLIGQVMSKARGKAQAEEVRRCLTDILNKRR